MAFIAGSTGALEDIAIVIGEIVKKAIQVVVVVVVVKVVRITDVVEVVVIEAIEIKRYTKEEEEMV